MRIGGSNVDGKGHFGDREDIGRELKEDWRIGDFEGLGIEYSLID